MYSLRRPRGTLTARVSTQWIETEDFEEEFSDAFNEPVSVRSLSASNGDGAQSCVESQNCPTSIIPGGEYAAIYESVAAVAGEKTISSEIEIESDGFLTAHQPFPNTERSQMVSSAHSFSETSSCNPSTSLTTGASSEAMPLGSSSSALMRRCKRLEKQRDEARAEAFAQASVAVQRGIEIENLSELHRWSFHVFYGCLKPGTAMRHQTSFNVMHKTMSIVGFVDALCAIRMLCRTCKAKDRSRCSVNLLFS